VKDDDYYGKHSTDKALAKFMATIVTPGKYGTLTFEGEDGEDWGYLIGRNEIRRLRKEWVLDGGVLLDDFLDSHRGA
jgi:hypothetical protein